MKKRLISAPHLLAILLLFVPAAILLTQSLGFDLIITEPNALCLSLCILSTVLTLQHLLKGNRNGKNHPLLPVIAAVCTLSLMLGCDYAPGSILAAILCPLCTILVSGPFRSNCLGRVLRFLFWAILCVIIFIFAVIGFSFNVRTALPELSSPDGAYIASAVIVDQGALGGDTVIDVYHAGELNLGFAKIRRFATETHVTGWIPPEQFRMEWLDNHTLLVNREKYLID